MEKPILLPIPGFAGYLISNTGEIYSYRYPRQRKLKLSSPVKLSVSISRQGYRRIGLRLDHGPRKKHRFKIAILVATVFIPNPKNLPIVNHINGNKLDDRVENLEWCTQSYNVFHSYTMGLQRLPIGELNANAILNEAQVLSIRKNTRNLSIPQLALEYHVSRSTIRSILNNNSWKHLK